ncbi:hypothetical protein GO685_01285 [Wolbachia endosymbiont of Madathamugadia hiepei]|uniref:hypothetical protein n=1 Tax=Wolbachia endosymbiont of Madathamugadia hiepei TaxID=1241303 RepID=UPI001589957F|nr:hypothetical protein [Wolbachia endosymbiont of Madathamugadia hiepei]NUX01157.1 hypothetical protein [Wolbachia endosymbiont of Madathamugadia hiepei]
MHGSTTPTPTPRATVTEKDNVQEELKTIAFKRINVPSELITETDRTANDGYLDEVEKWIKEPIQNHQNIKDLGMVPTPSPSYTSENGSGKSLLLDGKKTNRFLQKVKYVMQKKKVTIPLAGLVTTCCITAIALSVQQIGFIGFISSVNPVTIFGGVLASCLVLGIMWELIQAVRTEEHKIKERDTQKVLDEILDTLPKDKCIKSLVLKYSNGNRVYFTFHPLQGQEKNSAKIVELIGRPICYKSKVNSLVNDRLWLPILSTVLITGSITFPLTLYSTGGLSNIVNLYTNPTIYWPVVAISCTLLLFTAVYALHHWNKTDFKDYVLLNKQDASSGKLNETFIEVMKESQKDVSSKLLQVVAEPCGHPDITYIVN